ncbi:hypothetical protein YB2330_005292 [Saitoella coloradoensis]
MRIPTIPSLILAVWVALLGFVSAKLDTGESYGYSVIKTERFGSCSDNSILDASQFSAAYYEHNLSIIFDIKGHSLTTTQYVTASIDVFAYGETRWNISFDPCRVNIDGLCPLSTEEFDAFGLLPITPSMAKQIPAIAFHIPDFDGMVTIKLYNNETNEEVACLTSTLSNGQTFKHGYISWILGILAVVACLSSFYSVVAEASRPLDAQAAAAHSSPSAFTVFSFFQFIAFSGAVSVVYPVIFESWASNFAWSAGIIPAPGIVSAVQRFRNSTDGNYEGVYTGGVAKRAIYGQEIDPGMPTPGHYKGMQGLATRIGTTTTDLFMIAFIWFLVVVAGVIVFVVAFKVIMEILAKMRIVKARRLSAFRQNWLLFLGVTVLRLMLIAFFAMVTLSIYQLTLPDAFGPKIIAGLVLAIFIITLFYAAFHIIQIAFTRRNKELGERVGHPLYDNERTLKRWGWMYIQFKHQYWWFFMVFFTIEFFQALVLGLAQGHSLAQALVLMLLELVLLVLTVFWRPYAGRRANAIAILIALVRTVCLIIIFIFVDNFNFASIPRTVLGIVLIVIQAITMIIFVTFIVINVFFAIIASLPEDKVPARFRNRHHKYRERVFTHETDARMSTSVVPPEGLPQGAPASAYGVRPGPLDGEDVGSEETLYVPKPRYTYASQSNVSSGTGNSSGQSSTVDLNKMPVTFAPSPSLATNPNSRPTTGYSYAPSTRAPSVAYSASGDSNLAAAAAGAALRSTTPSKMAGAGTSARTSPSMEQFRSERGHWRGESVDRA